MLEEATLQTVLEGDEFNAPGEQSVAPLAVDASSIDLEVGDGSTIRDTGVNAKASATLDSLDEGQEPTFDSEPSFSKGATASPPPSPPSPSLSTGGEGPGSDDLAAAAAPSVKGVWRRRRRKAAAHDKMPWTKQFWIIVLGSIAMGVMFSAVTALVVLIPPITQFFVVYSWMGAVPFSLVLHLVSRSLTRHARRRIALSRGKSVEGILAKLARESSAGKGFAKGQLEAHFERQNSAIAFDNLKMTLTTADEAEHAEESNQARNLAASPTKGNSNKNLHDRMSMRYGFDTEDQETDDAKSAKDARKSVARVSLGPKGERASTRGPGGKGKAKKAQAQAIDDDAIEAARRRTQALNTVQEV